MQDHMILDPILGAGSSENRSQSDPSRVAITRSDEQDNSASSRSSCLSSRVREIKNPNCEVSGCHAPIIPSQTSFLPSSMRVSLSGVLDFFHIKNFSDASDDEFMFFSTVWFEMLACAKREGRARNGNCDRAHKALLHSVVNFCEEVSYAHAKEAANDGGDADAGS